LACAVQSGRTNRASTSCCRNELWDARLLADGKQGTPKTNLAPGPRTRGNESAGRICGAHRHSELAALARDRNAQAEKQQEEIPSRPHVSWRWKVNLGNREPTVRFVSRAGTRTWQRSSCSQVAAKLSRKKKQIRAGSHG
jgi:hypothetical protein